MKNDSTTHDKDWSKHTFQSEPQLLSIPEFAQEASAESAAEIARIFGFVVCNRHFLLEEGMMAELVADPAFTLVPNTPSHFLGLANVRGNIIPFYSLHPLLATELPQKTRYGLLVGRGAQAVMLMVDEKPFGIDTGFLANSSQALDLPNSLNAFVSHNFEYQGKVWGLLDARALFAFLCSSELEASFS